MTPDEMREQLVAALEAVPCIHGISDYDLPPLGCPECEADAVMAVVAPALEAAKAENERLRELLTGRADIGIIRAALHGESGDAP